MRRRFYRILPWLAGLPTLLFVCLAFITNVSTEVTNSDIAIFRTVLGLTKPERTLSFDEEISLIRDFQRIVFKAAPVGDPIPEYQPREPEDLIRNGQGLCYDRSRTYDKLFNWAGYESRHIYILYLAHPKTGERLSPWRAFFTYGIDSHAVTEIKTSMGWMLIDSNSPWISLDNQNRPVPASEIFKRQDELPNIPLYFRREYVAIPGLYSRRGQFYRPYVPFPELNWRDFIWWLLLPEKSPSN